MTDHDHDRQEVHEEGMKVRREVLGDAHVDRAEANKDGFTEDFQDFITRYAWGEVWSRPGLALEDQAAGLGREVAVLPARLHCRGAT